MQDLGVHVSTPLYPSQNVKKMVDRIKAFYRLNSHIFATLHKHLASSEVLIQQVREYQPPIYQPTGSI